MKQQVFRDIIPTILCMPPLQHNYLKPESTSSDFMQHTGHSTTAGVRSYKRIGEKLRCVTSDVLNSEKNVKTEEAPNTDSSECTPKCSSVDEN